ncbi:hypothetical protein [Niabella drilacis]|uniref:DUF4348 domain-containing protein n=1 Tax=Niabella drilacis (strain DSM 25811 / CCM 8410 / CCUG 62505 / LMG 26954 / E90) TaxID=1285928 RepID=A0A1G7BDK7_NIADE|nr:hypothetical protein [Niabella drilacis]SDE25101.1 hypothetical protein SAMN04487894_12914 [Niabella drilacis]
MCTVSDKLKLCTCKTENVEQLKHSWILYKYHKSEVILMGEPMLPQEYEIGKENEEYNKKKLETLLNERNCFDVDLTINNKDILELNFSCTSKANPDRTIHLVYEFIYKKDKWTVSEYDPFNTDKLQKQQGKIKTSFTKFQTNE